jgi:NADH-quinone oxidoreductase subunit N
MIQSDLQIFLPELMLAITAMVTLLVGVYTKKDALAPVLVWATAAMMLILAFAIGTQTYTAQLAFGGLVVADSFSAFAKVTILVAAAAVLIMGQDYMSRREMLRFEYPALVSLSVVGMMIMVSSANLMTLYMGLELQSLALYVIAAMRRDSVKSTEAGLKYFVLGALSSGLLLYGASLIYGYAGTTAYSGIYEAANGEVSLGLLLGLVFLMAGMAFKISAVPFHMWTPDVYEGAPTPVTAFFATAPKVAAMALFARVMFDAFGGVVSDWSQIIVILSVLSMFLGAFAAIGQTDLKRLMAYSSIAHMGYAMIGLAAGTEAGVQAMLVYMAIYVTMNIGAFAFIMMLSKDGQPITRIDALNQYASREPLKALAVLVLMFSLAGVPPMLGFFAKLGVWQAGVSAGLFPLVVASAVASAIGAYYYLRIVYLMYFGAESEPLDKSNSPVLWVFLIGSAAVMLVGLINLFGIDSPAAQAAAALVN